MLRFLICVLLLCSIYHANAQTITYNPDGYEDYSCPYGYNRFDLDYLNRRHWTFGSWGSGDIEHCALRDTQALCFKPNWMSKYWMTYTNGFGDFTIEKFDQFSFGSSYPDSTLVTGYTSYSSTLVPWYFTVRALYFYVRGATEVEILFEGPSVRTIKITSAELDWRRITFVGITWPESPTFWAIRFTFTFPFMQKVKFWGLYMVSCCEDLNSGIGIGK